MIEVHKIRMTHKTSISKYTINELLNNKEIFNIKSLRDYEYTIVNDGVIYMKFFKAAKYVLCVEPNVDGLNTQTKNVFDCGKYELYTSTTIFGLKKYLSTFLNLFFVE